MLYARVLEALDKNNEAVQIYENVLKKYGSEVEGECRLAMLLEKTGEKEKAKALYDELLKKAKRYSSHYRRAQREWIGVAKKRMKGLSAT